MIYDGHAYCFPDQRGDGGFDDPREFRRHLQLGMAAHFQPAWRARDRAPADSSGLVDPDNPWSFDGLREAGFRAAGHGRFEWTVGGEDYFKQVMPPSVTDMTYPADRLVAEMDYAGVDMALLHRSPYLGISNDFIADCVRQYPHRIQGLAYVPEWLVQPQPEASIAELRRAVGELGLSGLQFLTYYPALYGQTESWDSPGFTPFWDAVADLGLPVFFSLGGWTGRKGRAAGGPTAVLEAYLAQLGTLSRWMTRYPDVQVVLTHGFNWRMFMAEDGLAIPDTVLKAAPLDRPNFSVQLLFAIFLGGEWDYPMPQVRNTTEMLTRRLGADRLIWGTDIPMVLRFYPYRQSLDHIRRYRDSVSASDMEMIVGGNMSRLMGIGQ